MRKKRIIHFVSLFGVDYDYDIVNHWARYYGGKDFDYKTVYLHSGKNDNEKMYYVSSVLEKNGFATEPVSGVFCDGALRVTVMKRYVQNHNPDHYLVTADSDEFQCVENYHSLCDYDIYKGTLIDKYDKTLHNAVDDKPLQLQYPLTGNVEKEIMNLCPEDISKYWPKVKKDKIVMSPMGAPVAFGGSHQLYEENTEKYSFPGIIDKICVDHYSYRESYINRMCGKNYFNAFHIWYTKEFFNIKGIPDCLQKKIDEYEQTQKAKGWI